MKDEKLNALLAESKAIRNEAEQYLKLNGIEYKLSEWVTPKKYAKLFGLESTMVVTNWISRGVIPPQNVITIPELNDLKLIKAVPYRETVR